MTQSVPSKTALATSLASARVGRGLLIIESSISVAVMTNLPATLHSRMSFFCTEQTRSSGISTPRSPRATMIPSDTLRIPRMFSSASWLSILAMTWMPFSTTPGISRTAVIPAADRVKEWAMYSTFWSTANAMSSLSLAVRCGRSTEQPGKLTPLLPTRSPPMMTWQRTSPVAGSISRVMNDSRPSSTRITSPVDTVSARRSKVVQTPSWLPTREVSLPEKKVNMSPLLSVILPPSISRWTRTSGPLVSRMTGQIRRRSSAASRTLRMTVSKKSYWPWEAFRRTADMPASSISPSFCLLLVAGPAVQMILVMSPLGLGTLKYSPKLSRRR
mmetsp:Transcript_17057/g.43249  ORF Transcript_17057/g.43249 Transcript_17057/m.43249 type:complete len:330 (-) Transcript_17057:80-1069(-)